MKDQSAAELSSLVGTRAKLVKQRTALLNKLHALSVAHGRRERKEAFASEAGLGRVLEEQWSAVERVEVEVIVAQVRSLNAGIKRLEAEMSEQGKKLEGHENLTSIKGIGTRSATILLSVIGNIADFSVGRQVGELLRHRAVGAPIQRRAAHGQDHEGWLEAGTHLLGAMHAGGERVTVRT